MFQTLLLQSFYHKCLCGRSLTSLIAVIMTCSAADSLARLSYEERVHPFVLTSLRSRLKTNSVSAVVHTLAEVEHLGIPIHA